MSEEQELPYAWLEHRLAALDALVANHAQETRMNFAELRKEFTVIAVHTSEIETLKAHMKDVKTDVKAATANANKIAGVGAALAVLTGFFSGLWRH